MKQKRPPSLRLRLIAAFVFLGVALGPLVSGAMLWVSYTLEEEAVKATVQERLQHLLSTPEHYVLREHPRHPKVYVLSSFELEGVPDRIVVVTRWYGGVNLGGDRFAHIVTCTRAALAALRSGLDAPRPRR